MSFRAILSSARKARPICAAPLQRRGNLLLVQNPNLDCVPCQQEGCERHRESRSDCLDQMAVDRVVSAVEELLAERAPLAG